MTTNLNAGSGKSIKAITLWEPWASLIALGVKRIETRSWATTYRGLLAIHAGTHWTVAEEQIAETRFGDFLPLDWCPQFGCVIAVAQLVDCQRMTAEGVRIRAHACSRLDSLSDGSPDVREYALGHWEEGRYAWRLQAVHRITPFPVRGQQGLWDLELRSGAVIW